jgi:membrane protease YdiL (CAAX protease family)
VPCEKPVPPEMETVNTFKLPFYIISFLAIWLLVYNGLLSKILPQIKEWGEGHAVLLEVLLFSILAIIVFILLRKEFVRDFKTFIHNFGTYHNFVARGFFWIMVLNLGTGLVLNQIVGTTSENQAALATMPLWFMIIFGTLVGPMVEEGIYRGLLGKFIKNKVAFVIVSSLLFAAMHVVSITSLPESPMQYLFLIQYGVMGLVLSLNYARTKNIFSSYMIHMIMNGVATTLTALILL